MRHRRRIRFRISGEAGRAGKVSEHPFLTTLDGKTYRHVSSMHVKDHLLERLQTANGQIENLSSL